MKKIYFAPNWGMTSEQMVKDYSKQSPNNSGVWKDISVTFDVNEADYLIIQDNCDDNLLNEFTPEKIIYFSREALSPELINQYQPTSVNRFSFWDGTGYLWTKWNYPGAYGGIGMTYDELKSEAEPPAKNKIISCIQTNKSITELHRLRKLFIETYSKKYEIDVYGSISCSNTILKNNNKVNALDAYRYTFAFDNQLHIKNFVGTQVTDALLRWVVPIYCGGGDLNKYFPEKSFIQMDKSDLNDIDKMNHIINNDDFESRLNDITEARRLIMDKYNLWPTIWGIING